MFKNGSFQIDERGGRKCGENEMRNRKHRKIVHEENLRNKRERIKFADPRSREREVEERADITKRRKWNVSENVKRKEEIPCENGGRKRAIERPVKKKRKKKKRK